ncbi:lipoyl synthase [Candidatus Micrarchaeota archaeon]|nr:MAG: lipoyl synthase [Candidatus Micrarchaeota archaeon]
MEKPGWLKIRPPNTEKFERIKKRLDELGLYTVCQGAHCPNMSECWSSGTATFMIMGDTCTRGCRFCAVKKGAKGKELDGREPLKLAKAVKEFGLNYVVITSVDRDDLADGGAGHFADCVRAVKALKPEVRVEVLIPDFSGSEESLRKVVEARPDVIAHNIETTRAMQKLVRDRRANYEQSLRVLKNVKGMDARIYTKSSIMLGLGEKEEQVLRAMDDLREVQCDILTIGQYLRPSERQMEVVEYVKPDRFKQLKKEGELKGFLYVASGPFVRTSYRAGELFIKGVLRKQMGNEKR